MEAHFRQAFSKFHDFLKTDTFTDVRFSVQGKPFTAHKWMLSAHSPVFEAMFTLPMLEARSGEVTVNDVRPQVFEAFLNFLYTGIEPKTGENETVELLICADKYGVKSLVTACELLLCNAVCDRNAIELYMVGGIYKRPYLCKRTLSVMRIHMALVVQSEGWVSNKGNTRLVRKIISRIWRKYESGKNARIFTPEDTGRAPKIGDFIQTLIQVHRGTMNHLCPREVILFPESPHWRCSRKRCAISCFVIFHEDKIHNNRLFVYLRVTGLHESMGMQCEVSITSIDKPDVVLDSKETGIFWSKSAVHPTMGCPGLRIYEEKDVELPKTGVLFFVVSFKRLTMKESVSPAPYGALREPPNFFPNVPHSPEESVDDAVHLTCDESSEGWHVLLKPAGERMRNFFNSKGIKSLHIPNTPRETLEILLSSIYLNETPDRSFVNVAMLKAACLLHTDHYLIMYLEHALVWDLDPWNCLDMIEAGSDLGLMFLKHGALQYFRLHFDRVIESSRRKWKNLKADTLEEILVNISWGDFNRKVNFLPRFLTSRGRPESLN